MKDKIKDILDKIYISIENDCVDVDKQFQYFKFKNADAPVKKQKVLIELFPCGAPDIIDIDIYQRYIVECKRIAISYYRSELVIADYHYSKSIIMYYYETPQDIFKRLSIEYNILLNQINKNADEEYKKYKELKLKYEPNTIES